MQEPSFSHLQHAAQEVAKSQTAEEKIASLIKAFELFNLETQNLAGAYEALKEQFKAVNLELEESNRQLKLKISELDVITYYLDSILSNISQGIIFIDLIGNITTYNSSAERILEVDRLDVLFQPFWNKFNDEHFGFSMSKALKNKRAPHMTFTTIKLPNGQMRELEIDTSFVLQKRNETTITRVSPTIDFMKGLIVILRDMTDLKRLQGIANRNDRMKELGEMAAKVAHEIRNPLGGIKGFAALLQRDLAANPELQKMAHYIVEGTDTINHLVNNVLTYSRPMDLHLESIDLNELLKEIIDYMRADALMTAKHQLVIHSKDEKIFAPVDASQFKSALLNIVINGIQAMPDGGKIEITLRRDPKMAVVIVKDEGTGIAPENLENIFSPFFTTKEQGNGFGLAEVYKIMQVHGGTIDVESEIGKGSTFALHFPLSLDS
ncbi:MAG: ATP-binding protein [Parachlamydiales bacterium]|jgi:signal transduction histidine kinase